MVNLVIMLQEKLGHSTYNELMLDFEDAVSDQRSACLPSSKLSDLKETRFQSQVKHRLAELEGNYLQEKIYSIRMSLAFPNCF